MHFIKHTLTRADDRQQTQTRKIKFECHTYATHECLGNIRTSNCITFYLCVPLISLALNLIQYLLYPTKSKWCCIGKFISRSFRHKLNIRLCALLSAHYLFNVSIAMMFVDFVQLPKLFIIIRYDAFTQDYNIRWKRV